MNIFKLIATILFGLGICVLVGVIVFGSAEEYERASKNHRVSSDQSDGCGMMIGDLIIDKVTRDTLVIVELTNPYSQRKGVYARNKKYNEVLLPCQTFEPLEDESRRYR